MPLLSSALRAWWGQRRPPPTVALRNRCLISAVVFVASGLFAYHQLTARQFRASDFEYALRAATRVMAGGDPYADPAARSGLPYPNDARFPYPLNAALLAVPLTPLDPYVAGALFVAALSALMALGVTRDGLWRLSVFLSPSYFVAASVANWTPLIVAAAFLPLLYPLAIAKPNLALPVLLEHPSARGYALAAAVILVSLAAVPTWPLGWLGSLADQHGKYVVPLAVAGVVPVLLALLWGRMRSARLLVMLAAVPQHAFFYDQLPLWLIPRTIGQSLALSAATWAAYLAWPWTGAGGDPLIAYTPLIPTLAFTGPLFYLPDLGIVAWQRWSRPGHDGAGASVPPRAG